MTLRQWLLPIAAMVAVSSGQFCTEEPFTDISANARHDCVKGNFHVYCGNGAPLTLFAEDHTAQFGYLVFVSGFWFAFKCGSLPILLDATPTLSCPPTPCGGHSCVFVNSDGAEPQSSCIGGNVVKSCPDGNLFIGAGEYTNAACSSNGKWVSWTCDGDVEVTEGALSAACSRTQCADPAYLTADDPAFELYGDYALDNSQLETIVHGKNTHVRCKFPYVFVHADDQIKANPPHTLSCDVVEGQWIMEYGNNEYDPLEEAPVGCVMPSCSSDTQFLDGSESGLASVASEFVMHSVVMTPNSYFIFICPAGSELAHLEGSKLVWAAPVFQIYCSAEEGWLGDDGVNNKTVLQAHKYGCFAPKCSNSLVYMRQPQVSALVGVTVDVSQKATFVDGAFQLKCSLDAQLATITGTTLTAQNWWLGCGESGWMVKEEGKADAAYTNVAVGCIKPTCTGMNLFSGTETVLATKPNYEFVDVQPSFANNKWELKCPSDCLIGYAETPTFLAFEVTMKVTCEAAGWWARTASNPTGIALSPKKIGCFRKIVPSG